MMNTLRFFVMCLVIGNIGHIVHGVYITSKENLRLERQLNLVNKSPIKSIHTNLGHIVDCVDINKQLAFDHPLLKDHKLQTKPSFEIDLPTKSIYALEKVSCPEGTVPIQRITKDDLKQDKSSFNVNLTQNGFRRFEAKVFVIPKVGPFYGVSGTTSVYHPKVILGQDSSSHLYVQNGANKIVVGWHVSPQLYKNDNTHLYSFWQSDNLKTGCFNTRCPGFIQTSSKYYIGGSILKTSIIGKQLVDLEMTLIQDPKSHNWWLSVAKVPIGYFPARLFQNLGQAVEVGWGGSTVTSSAIAPPMGSGYFPQDYIHTCYFKHISYQTDSRKDIGPEVYYTGTLNNAPKCYLIDYNGDQRGPVGYVLQFGGPGGNC